METTKEILKKSEHIKPLLWNYLSRQVEEPINLTDEELVDIYNEMVRNNELHLLFENEITEVRAKLLE